MNGGSQAALKNLCAIFKVPEAAAKPNPTLALHLLLHVYGMPLIRAKPPRRDYGNGILGATRGQFDPFSPFTNRLRDAVVMMQEYPHLFRNLSLTTEHLVARYKSIAFRNRVLEVAGVVGGASAATAGIGEGIKKGDVRAGLKKTLGRAAGHGPLTEAISERFGPKLPKGSVSGVAIVAIVGANLAYFSGKDQLVEIKAILTHRFQQGKMTKEQYASVFGNAVDPSSVKKYWEYRG